MSPTEFIIFLSTTALVAVSMYGLHAFFQRAQQKTEIIRINLLKKKI